MRRGKIFALSAPLAVWAAVMTLALVIGSVCAVDSAYAQCSGGTPVTMTFKNQNHYPVWLGDNTGGGTVTPPSGTGGKGYNLEIPANGQMQVCTSSNVSSGIFWARTECDFTPFSNDPDNDYVDCNSQSDCCTTGNTCAPTGKTTLNNHICYGGKCVIDCSTGTGTNGACSGATNPLPNSVCVASAHSAAPYYAPASFCSFSNGVCKTGDCGTGLWQCQGAWQNTILPSPVPTTTDTATATPTPMSTPVPANLGPAPPASVFELTDAGVNTTYDASNIGGYNTAVGYTVPTDAPISCAYSPVGCVSDLNTSCPSLLQVTEGPTGATGPISCGPGTFCQSGACVDNTCVIGCTGPSKCAAASSSSALQTLCTTLIAGGSGNNFTLDGTTYPADGAEFQDMFGNVNTSGSITFGSPGDTMISLDGGTYLCWGDKDCPPTDNCLLGSASGITNFPSYVGICVNSSSGEGDQPAPANCTSSSTPTGQDCGQYNGMGAFTCVSATTTQGDACVPNFNPPIIGFGTFDSSTGFYTGVGGFPNPEWVYAALVVSGGSTSDPWGTTPFYQTFSEACPYEYQYPYDDKAGSFTCQTDITSAVTVTFGLSGPTATATATSSATASPTVTATATSSATAFPTATATATSTSSSTSTLTPTATATATATATSTATLTPTATATMTASATSSATPTPTPTMTPSPTGTATPNCTLNFDLTNTGPQPLAFGDVSANVPVTLPLTVTNEASSPLPAGTLSLSWKIKDIVKNGGASAFKVTGGSCKKNKKLKNNSSCTYNVRLKAKPSEEGKAVNAQLLITGQFVGKVCPGHKQSVAVTLAGDVLEPAARPTAGR
jgi:Thaumatin family